VQSNNPSILDSPDVIDPLVEALILRLQVLGIGTPRRILLFLIANWEVQSAYLLERILSQLAQQCPIARLEAIWLTSRAEATIEVILVAEGMGTFFRLETKKGQSMQA